MVEINREHVQHLVRQNQSLGERIDALKQKLSTAMSSTKTAMSAAGQRLTRPGNAEHLVRTLEVNGAAFLGGLAQGKSGPAAAHFLGIPFEAWAGAALEAAGYFGLGGDQLAEHAINLGDGFLASWTSSVGFHMGENWRTSGHLFGHQDRGSPALAASNGTAVKGEITPQQMAQIVARVRGAAAMHGMDPPHG